ncbi:MAG: PilN domain-containing protein [Burkholderiaceae bacterium]
MILINLLPHREAARKRAKEAFFVALAIAALVGGAIAGSIFLWFQNEISLQQSKNSFLTAEVSKLDAQIKDIEVLQTEIAALRARQQAVEDLQSDRNLPVYLLNELVKVLPDGVIIASMKQDNQTVEIKGLAQSNERIAELLRNLGNNSPWLTKPVLIEIVAANIAISPKEQRRVASFTMKADLIRASQLTKAAAAASAAAAAKSAASAAKPASAAKT